MKKDIISLIEERFEIEKQLKSFVQDNKDYSDILSVFFLQLKDPEMALGIRNLMYIRENILPTKSKEEFLKILLNFEKAKKTQLSFFSYVFKTIYVYRFLINMNMEKTKEYNEFISVIEHGIKDKDLRTENMINYLEAYDLY